MVSKQRKRRSLSVLFPALAPAFLPVAYVLYLALNSGEVPSNDYWMMLAKFFSAEGFSTDPADWFQFHNNHVLTFSYVIYAANILLAKGSNLGLSLIGWGLALIQMAILFVLVPGWIWCDRLWRYLLPISIAAFTFTPSSAVNWIYGFSGVHYGSSFMFSVASIWLFSRYLRHPHPRWFIGSLGLALVATLSYTSSMPLWPLLFLSLALHRRFRSQAAVVLGIAAVISLAYFFNYQPQPEITPADVRLSEYILFIPACLGGIFTTCIEAAVTIGSGGLLLSAYLMRRVFLHAPSRRRIVPWVLLHGLAAGDVLMAAAVRAGRGLEEPVSSRFAPMPALYWLSLIVIASLVFRRSAGKRRRVLAASATVTVCLLIAMMYLVGLGYARPLLSRASLQPIAEISIQIGVPDTEAIKRFVTPWPAAFVKLLPALKRYGISPYRKMHNQPGRVGTFFQNKLLVPDQGAGSLGGLRSIHLYSISGAQCSGWISHSGGTVRGIVILNQENVIRGFGASGLDQPWTARRRAAGEEVSGWVGYAVPGPGDRFLTACALFSGDDHWMVLGRPRRLPEGDGSENCAQVFSHYRRGQWQHRWFNAGRFLSRAMWQRYGKLGWR